MTDRCGWIGEREDNHQILNMTLHEISLLIQWGNANYRMILNAEEDTVDIEYQVADNYLNGYYS